MKILNRFTDELILEIDLLKNKDLTRTNLSGANLSGANLSGANLSGANLSGADLSWANLSGANLSGANLSGANLSGADLTRANLTGANLSRADLTGADLTRANLTRANLYEANLTGAKLPNFLILPDGDLIVWKKLSNGTICKLKILADVKRINSLVGRKCRAERAIVLEGEGTGIYNKDFKYEPGKEVIADSFDDDIRIECSHGIHFFITRKEAEEHD
jgi:hypothetical protein